MEEASKRLEGLSGQLARWRKATPKRTRLPEEFWAEAVEIARECGLYRVAKRLPVDWRQLKRRMGETAAPAARKSFVEVRLPMASNRCVLERETKQGRMRLELAGWTPVQMAELVRALEA